MNNNTTINTTSEEIKALIVSCMLSIELLIYNRDNGITIKNCSNIIDKANSMIESILKLTEIKSNLFKYWIDSIENSNNKNIVEHFYNVFVINRFAGTNFINENKNVVNKLFEIVSKISTSTIGTNTNEYTKRFFNDLLVCKFKYDIKDGKFHKESKQPTLDGENFNFGNIEL